MKPKSGPSRHALAGSIGASTPVRSGPKSSGIWSCSGTREPGETPLYDGLVVELSASEKAALTQQLRDLLKEVQEEERQQGKATHRLGRLGGRLAVAAAIGSAVAGLVTALSQSLHGAARLIVIIVAFGGAATSGTAAALRAPERAHGAQGRWLELRSLARRLEVISATGLDDRTTDELKTLIDEVLDRLDQIQGARDSQSIRVSRMGRDDPALASTPPIIDHGQAVTQL